MKFGNLLFQQPYNIRKQVRNIETNEKKPIQAKMAVVFKNTYIYLYKYIYLYIYIINNIYSTYNKKYQNIKFDIKKY